MPPSPPPVLLAGHRGSGQTDAPHARRDPLAQAKPAENSLPSLRQAFADGADFVEVDAVRTKDDQLVVVHSDQLSDHVFGPLPAERVGDLTLAELRRLRFGRRGDGQIATLPEVLALAAEAAPAASPIALNIEIKDTKGTHAPRRSIVDLVLRDVAAGPLPADRILFSSFALQDLKDVQERAPGMKLGLLFDHAGSGEGPMYADIDTPATRYRRFTPQRIAEATAEVPLTHLHPEISSIGPQGIAQAAQRGLGLNSWGLKERLPSTSGLNSVLALAREQGVVMGVITDFVPQMRQILRPWRLDSAAAPGETSGLSPAQPQEPRRDGPAVP